MDSLVSLPSPTDEGYVSLSRTPQGRLIRKKILPMNGSFVHPADHKTKIFVDKAMAQSIVNNFNRGVCSTVQVPIVDGENRHVEDPLRNAGEVIDVEYDDTGVYATIDARKYADDFGKTILGASAFMHLNYVDTATGERVGPTLLHVAATNRPHVNGLGDYEDVIKASADNLSETEILFMSNEGEEPEEDIKLSNKAEETMTFDEMLAELKDKHNVDVADLQAKAADAVKLSSQLEEVNNQLKLSANGTEVTVSDLAEALVELSASNKDKDARLAALEEANQGYVKLAAENEVDGYIREGRVFPQQRDALVALSLSDRETFDKLIPDTAVVKLSEAGVTVHETPSEEHTSRVAEYVARANKK